MPIDLKDLASFHPLFSNLMRLGSSAEKERMVFRKKRLNGEWMGFAAIMRVLTLQRDPSLDNALVFSGRRDLEYL